LHQLVARYQALAKRRLKEDQRLSRSKNVSKGKECKVSKL
jgi:hypothetical protein